MLGLEDAFARRGGRGQLDSIKVPELVEAARRQLLRISSEAPRPWGCPAAKEEWHNSAMLGDSDSARAEQAHSRHPGESPSNVRPDSPLVDQIE